MPYYRIKVVKCIDAVIYADSVEDAVDKLRASLSYCGGNAKVFIHVVDKKGPRPVDKGVVVKGTIKEVLRDML